MGCSQSHDDEKDDPEYTKLSALSANNAQRTSNGLSTGNASLSSVIRKPSTSIADPKNYPSSLHAIMHQATMVAGAMVQVDLIEDKIRRAKQEMKTITVRDGTLYIDYQFQGYIPPGMRVIV